MIFLLLGCILFNYFAGLALHRQQKRKLIFVIGIIVNLSVLILFKYTVFFIKSFNDISAYFETPGKLHMLDIILPVGISFYTFHNISYLFDIYREKIVPTKNIVTFSVYDLFFPLLLSGPIERPDSLIPQIESERKMNMEDAVSGTILFAWGIFKKVFVADNLSPFVNKALDPSSDIPPGIIYFVAPAFAFQVYADFSGYTDAARGMARIMGFRLSLNFNLPFLSSNPVEFWKRWHISLSSWLRDYL
ncbi:MAG: MBOAT family protein, partial [Leptospira sp.]|nr:MBOAT family protein [Leptospira sp.]